MNLRTLLILTLSSRGTFRTRIDRNQLFGLLSEQENERVTGISSRSLYTCGGIGVLGGGGYTRGYNGSKWKTV